MFRDILARASIYSLFEQLVGAKHERRLYVERYVRPRAGHRVLDIGCGPADIMEALPDVDYHGFDMSADYIASARKRFGTRGKFHVETVNRELEKKYVGFDLVLAIGVLHHLPNEEALDLFRLAYSALKPGGRLVTLDGCFQADQSFLARQMLLSDRGKYIREKPAYIALAQQVFSDITPVVATDLLWIPYTHLIMECSRDAED